VAITYEGASGLKRQIVRHHAVLRRGVERRAGTVCGAPASGVPYARQLTALRESLDTEALPHVAAEERMLHRAAATRSAGADWCAPHAGAPA
jgi:hypothetical protein